MIRRSINSRFKRKVLDGVKVTTIRDKAWPLGKQVMLFVWTGAPYRSKQENVVSVVVDEVHPVKIFRGYDDVMSYTVNEPLFAPLWELEGFDSQMDMDKWFRPLLKQNEEVEKWLSRFSIFDKI